MSRSLNKYYQFDYTQDLTSLISLLSFVLSIILSIFYYFSSYETLYLQVALTGFLMLTPLILTRMGFQSTGTILLCFLVCLVPFGLSLYNKSLSIGVGIVNPVNYFDVRLLIICSILVPMTAIPLRQNGLLMLGTLPSFLGLVLYDPIHDWMGVGYYDAGLNSVDYYFSANLFSAIAWIFLALAFLFLKNKIERNLEKEQFRRSLLEKYMKDLMETGSVHSIKQGAVREGYKEVLATIAKSLGLEGVSIWEFDDEYDCMTCRLGKSEDLVYRPGVQINFSADEEYFSDLLDKGIIISDQGRDLASNEVKKYRQMHRGNSFIDIIFLRQSKPKGIISCEITDRDRSWLAEDSLYLKACADMLSLLHANHVQRQRNEELEIRVAERTSELQATNKELREYSFLNSHILRAPVARVFGMYQVIQAEYSEFITDEILTHFKMSIEELDKITRRIDAETKLKVNP